MLPDSKIQSIWQMASKPSGIHGVGEAIKNSGVF